MKYDNQLRYACEILESFQGEMPLHNWLKLYFRENRQMGSRDRKQIAELVYCYYRLGHGWKEFETKERILIGLFLCNSIQNELLDYFKPNWNKEIQSPLLEKLSLLNEKKIDSSSTGIKDQNNTHLEQIFPWKEYLSKGMDHLSFCSSFLQQPDLFIRIRPGFNTVVKDKLKSAELSFLEVSQSCLAIPNGSAVDKVLTLNKEAVIQDLNSQKVVNLIAPREYTNRTSKLQAWDCCAASGGKSIMLKDLWPAMELTVSDKRESILKNLSHRFHEAGLNEYHSFLADLSTPGFNLPFQHSFDLIIADLPCTGSGTWSRTPESLYFFETREIDSYAKLQRSILKNILPKLNPGGALIYSTCSVFREENEDQVAFITNEFDLKEEKTELLKGYNDKADSMFVCRLIR